MTSIITSATTANKRQFKTTAIRIDKMKTWRVNNDFFIQKWDVVSPHPTTPSFELFLSIEVSLNVDPNTKTELAKNNNKTDNTYQTNKTKRAKLEAETKRTQQPSNKQKLTKMKKGNRKTINNNQTDKHMKMSSHEPCSGGEWQKLSVKWT